MKTILVEEFNFYGLKASESQINSWVEELSDLSKEEVLSALKKLRKDPSRTRPPMPALIRQEISGWIGPEQAWAEAPKSEYDSAVLTNEAATALGSAMKFLDSGDYIQARLTFIEVYKYEVQRAQAQNKKPKWFASFGAYSSQENREKAILEAVDKNRICVAAALDYFPNIKIQSKPDLKLLTHVEISEEQREKNLSRIGDLLRDLDEKSKTND